MTTAEINELNDFVALVINTSDSDDEAIERLVASGLPRMSADGYLKMHRGESPSDVVQ